VGFIVREPKAKALGYQPWPTSGAEAEIEADSPFDFAQGRLCGNERKKSKCNSNSQYSGPSLRSRMTRFLVVLAKDKDKSKDKSKGKGKGKSKSKSKGNSNHNSRFPFGNGRKKSKNKSRAPT
jgi:hypothetical protein